LSFYYSAQQWLLHKVFRSKTREGVLRHQQKTASEDHAMEQFLGPIVTQNGQADVIRLTSKALMCTRLTVAVMGRVVMVTLSLIVSYIPEFMLLLW
jgi:hypothetical protein